jgi:hypothetical protein
MLAAPMRNQTSEIKNVLPRRQSGKPPMHARYSLIIIFMLAFISPAFASYWIVRGSDNKCLVVDMEPTDKTISKVGKDVYSSREEAEADVKKLCKD